MTKKIALVTGAMGGIGTEISKFLARDGFIVVANCLPAYPQKDEWLAKMKAEGFDFIAAEGDIASYESCAAMVKKIETEVGPIDVLVNNAGITRDGMFRKMDRAQWDAVIDINLSGVFNVTHQVIGGMADRG
ncbi:MAG TPA: SDR family NAD(P)-dependent oxidoreductase, partial [Rhodocyclaceae bacterium]|nr:SDR family NAD(P)-dependent oxidoreductase [Rhodocyclaceae bacterium]